MKKYKIKDDFDLYDLKDFGYEYVGNYNRGDNWQKIVDGIDDIKPKNGITIHGDWDNRRCCFRFPYRKTTDNLDILPFITDLNNAGLIEEVVVGDE